MKWANIPYMQSSLFSTLHTSGRIFTTDLFEPQAKQFKFQSLIQTLTNYIKSFHNLYPILIPTRKRSPECVTSSTENQNRKKKTKLFFLSPTWFVRQLLANSRESFLIFPSSSKHSTISVLKKLWKYLANCFLRRTLPIAPWRRPSALGWCKLTPGPNTATIRHTHFTHLEEIDPGSKPGANGYTRVVRKLTQSFPVLRYLLTVVVVRTLGEKLLSQSFNCSDNLGRVCCWSEHKMCTLPED